MAENMGKWPSGHRKTKKSGHRLAAEKTLFPRRVVWGYDLCKPGGHLGNVGVVVEVRGLGAFGDWEKAGVEVKGL